MPPSVETVLASIFGAGMCLILLAVFVGGWLYLKGRENKF